MTEREDEQATGETGDAPDAVTTDSVEAEVIAAEEAVEAPAVEAVVEAVEAPAVEAVVEAVVEAEPEPEAVAVTEAPPPEPAEDEFQQAAYEEHVVAEGEELLAEDDAREAELGTEAAMAAAQAGAVTRPGRAASAAPALTPSELAVHIDDRISKVFVVAVVAVFVAIILNGLLFGTAGFFTPLPTPEPIPTESASPAP